MKLRFIRGIYLIPIVGIMLFGFQNCTKGGFDSLSSTQSHANPQHGNAISAKLAQESASARTLELMTLHKQLLKASENARAELHRQLLLKAEERRQLLLELAKSHPEEVLRVAIPNEKQKGMPADVVAKLERSVELEGELEVLYEDYEDGSHKLRHFLKTSSEERFELHLAKAKRELHSGLKVRAQGLLLASADDGTKKSLQGDLVVNDDDSGLLLLADGATSAPELPYAIGEQKTLVILVTFQDKPDDRPPEYITVADWNNLVFGEVSNFFKEASFGKTWLSGDTVGWFTIPQNSTSCDQNGIANDARAAASNAGVDLSVYKRFVFVFPWNSACGWGGQGTVSRGPGSYAWINGQPGLQTTAHELGHNLGLGHSEFLDCDVSPLGDSCSRMSYGDYLDVMGGSPSGHFNGYHKERLGWLPASGIQAIETSGRYVIDSYIGTGTGMPRVLKVLKGVDAQTGAKSWYYLESRQAGGFDSYIANSNYVIAANVLNGVVIHQAKEGVYISSLLDMTPGSSRLDDMKDPALTVGRSFTDPATGVTITTEAVDSSQALVRVELGSGSTPICTRSAPVVSVSPGQSSWLPAGSSYTYTVSVTNKDSSGCTSSSFSLVASKPSGWSDLLGSSSLSLAPGASSSTTLKITSPSTAVDGFYSIGASATANGLSASGSASFVIDNPTADTTLPTVSITSPASGATVSGIINVIASASDNVAVSKVEFYIDGVLKLTDTTATYSMSLDTKTLANGSHTLMAKAYDSSNNSSSAQISVNVSNSTADTTAPSVTITSPASGAVISPRTSITIQASATDNVKVSRVEFYVNGSLICSDTTASYSCSYQLGGAKGAVYTIEARAYDSSGNMGQHQISISSSGSASGGGGKGGRK